MSQLRSLLFVPANQTKKVTKAFSSNADCLILDLEDSIARSEKASARRAVQSILRDHCDKPVYVRVNSFDTPYLLDDLLAVLPEKPAGVMLPKVETGAQLQLFAWLSRQLPATTPEMQTKSGLIALIETARGVSNANEIAAATDDLACLAFGAIDFSLDIGTKLTETSEEILYARSTIVIASRVASRGKPIDTVYPDFKNDAGLRRQAEMAKNIGFQGKMVIHPNQIDIVNEIFSCSPEEIEYAKKIVAAFAEAEKNGSAAVDVDGKMVDYPVMKRARQILDSAG